MREREEGVVKPHMKVFFLYCLHYSALGRKARPGTNLLQAELGV